MSQAMKEDLRRLFLATLEDLSLDRIIPRCVTVRDSVLTVGEERINLNNFKKLILIALGKAAFQMAQATKALLDPKVASGVVVSSEPPTPTLPYMVHYQGAHP